MPLELKKCGHCLIPLEVSCSNKFGGQSGILINLPNRGYNDLHNIRRIELRPPRNIKRQHSCLSEAENHQDQLLHVVNSGLAGNRFEYDANGETIFSLRFQKQHLVTSGKNQKCAETHESGLISESQFVKIIKHLYP
jgi:hypothetical protein